MNYTLPKLQYKYKDLEPYMSEEQLTIHYTKHHQAYVNGANGIFDKLDKARKDNSEVDVKAVAKELSFNIAGHQLHSLFWNNLSPASKSGKPKDELLKAINAQFGSVERFKSEFTKAAQTVEGSGWAALGYDVPTGRLVIMQIEKHNVNVNPEMKILLVVDVFEHAYYVDYKNDRAKFLEAFWNIVNWYEVEERFEEAK